jgi:hypothetical protein
MLARIHVTNGKPLERIRAEGPYEPIVLNESSPTIVPKQGPLAGTPTQWPRLWCALDDGSIIVADKTGDNPPPFWKDGICVRGYYDLDRESDEMCWHPIGSEWKELEIKEVQLLSNISYRLYKKLPSTPQRIFLFGAGASYGSDSFYVRRKGLLPPLGFELYPLLRDAPNLKLWGRISADLQEAFVNRPFEEAMELLDESEDGGKFALGRDIELAEFFSQYRVRPTSLYRKLAFRVRDAIAGDDGWTGAFITLNYERLLEESLLDAKLFPCVKGITYYDRDPIDLPEGNLVEVSYPHGACQFIMSHGDRFNANIREQITIGEIHGLTGAHHLLLASSVTQAYKEDLFPMICRYQAHKRPSINNYFIREQKQRAAELIQGAETITIIGVICAADSDMHLWEPLSKCSGKIYYVDPSANSINIFKDWAEQRGKAEGQDFEIMNVDFHHGFNDILRINGLKLAS